MGFGRVVGLKTDVLNLDVEGYNEYTRKFSDKIVDIEGDILFVLAKHDQTREDGVVMLVSPVRIDTDETIKYLFLKTSGNVKYVSDIKLKKWERAEKQRQENAKAKREGRDPIKIGEIIEKESFFDELSTEQIGILLEEGQVIEDGTPMSLINLMRKYERYIKGTQPQS